MHHCGMMKVFQLLWYLLYPNHDVGDHAYNNLKSIFVDENMLMD